MKIAVCVKQVLDASVPLRVVNGIVQQGSRSRIAHLGAADVAALEQALMLRARAGGEVMAISVGEAEAVEALRFCAALGADHLVQVQHAPSFDPVSTAMAVSAVLRTTVVYGSPLPQGEGQGEGKEQRGASRLPDLILCGTQSGDGASGYFPAVLASELDWPLVTAVAAVSLDSDAAVRLERRLERGNRDIVRCPLPAVLACEPTADPYRFIPVRALRRAMRVPIEILTSTVSVQPSCELIALEPAKPRPKRVSGPDASASPMDRLAHLLSGGVQQKQSNGFVQGSADQVAAEIIRFLEEKGFLKTERA